jgi:diadenosine tetraphosphatase ApaH/serine/threonine PP2A family protein phosphatase
MMMSRTLTLRHIAILKHHKTFLSTESKKLKTRSERDDGAGAWTVLAALEKAKESQGIQVARLVSSLEALLPRSGYDLSELGVQQQHTNYQQHTTDPAFFSLSPESLSNMTGDEVLKILESTRRGRRVDLRTIEALVKAATGQFRRSRPSRVVSLPPLNHDQQLTVIGDLHGSLSDLEAVLGLTGAPSYNNLLLFNGDLADRGDHGIEVIAVVCALYLAYPEFVFVNRGNHEDLALSIAYGLAAEVQHKYGASVFRDRLIPLLDAFFCSLPLATIVEKDALIVHAGPPPPGVKLSDVKQYLCERDDGSGFSRTIRTDSKDLSVSQQQQSRAQEVVEALLWSDPAVDENAGSLEDYQGQKFNDEMLGWIPNVSRGAGYKFDSDIVRNVLHAEGLIRLVRSHEPGMSGK